MAIITLFADLSSATNNAIFILLVLFAFILLAGSATYVVLKGTNLYREHRATEALARKVLDTEALRTRTEASTPKDNNTAAAKPDFSLVPSLPPVVIIAAAPHAGNPYHAPAIARSFSYGRTHMIAAGRGGRGVSPFHANASVMIQCVEPGRPALPWVRSGEWDGVGRGNAPMEARRGGVVGDGIPKAWRSASVDKRRVLGPLSVVELERRRIGTGKGAGKATGRRRNNGPRVVGKENVVV